MRATIGTLKYQERTRTSDDGRGRCGVKCGVIKNYGRHKVIERIATSKPQGPCTFWWQPAILTCKWWEQGSGGGELGTARGASGSW